MHGKGHIARTDLTLGHIFAGERAHSKDRPDVRTHLCRGRGTQQRQTLIRFCRRRAGTEHKDKPDVRTHESLQGKRAHSQDTDLTLRHRTGTQQRQV